MANVFLSYDREDAAKARMIANSLEKSGHSVWWDRHIKGGAQYSREIEQALKAAEAVVVLWSAQSVDSAWVRDEAAAGRDTGRLVPVSLDGCEPPLGFRQYQTIRLPNGTSRLSSRTIQELTAAIANLGTAAAPAAKERAIAILPRELPMRPLLILAAIIGIAIALTLFVWRPWVSAASAPTVAIVAGDESKRSKALAGNLLVQLGSLQAARADELQLVEAKAGNSPDFTFKVGDIAGNGDQGATLSFIDSDAGTLLWSREYAQPSANAADLRQQLAYSAAQVLRCATEALSFRDRSLSLATLKLYLSGCANMSSLLAQDPQVAVSIFEKVTEQAPNFKGGWKKLLLAKIQALRFGFSADPVVRRDLQESTTQAQRLDPAMGEAFLAQAWLAPPRPITGFMKLIDRAVAADPENPDILAFQAIALTNVGLMEDALAATRRAVESNPLSPSARDALIVALLNSDEVEAARNELAKSEQLWPGATNVLQSRFAVEFRVGDPARALRMLQSGQLGAGFVTNAAHESYLRAKIEHTSENKELAIVNARALYIQEPTASWVYARALAEFDRHEQLIDFLLRIDPRIPYTTTWVIFRPSFAKLHSDRRFVAIAHRFGMSDFWRDTGKWPDFCARPDLPYDCKAEVAKLG